MAYFQTIRYLNNITTIAIMKRNIYFYSIIILLVSCFSSCEEEYTYTEIIETTDRLFRPPLLETNIDGNEVTFKWIPIKNSTYYLELSRDSMAFQNEVQKFEIKGKNDFLITDLWSKERYSARIKAVSTNPSVKDSEFQTTTFITGIENIFYVASNITANSVLLNWDKEKDVSKIEVYDGATLLNTSNVTSNEKNTGTKQIDGLMSQKEYTFKIYLGAMLRGTISVKTL